MTRIIPKNLYFLLLSLWMVVNVHSQTFPVEVLKYSGSPNEYLNIVLMGDGYTSSEQEKFINDARNAAEGFLNQKPFSVYKDSINIFAVKVVSNVTGASMDPDNLIDNYFGSSYWSYGIERLLVSWNYSEIVSVLNANTPFYDEAAIVVNHSKYGGAGGQYATFSTHADAIELFLHEFGHSFADLADEYWAGEMYAAEKTNMTQNNNPNTIKWKEFLYVNGIGIYAYEESTTWYRPHQSCKMRYLGVEFCDVCQNKISRDLEFIANTDTVGIPIAYFGADKVLASVESIINFYDFSTYQPKSWEWTFEGGNPETSIERNPSVTYNNEGVFAVSLKVTNEQGENMETKSNYITVQTSVTSVDIDRSNSITIYPNPAQDILSLVSNNDLGIIRYRIINTTGISIMEGLTESKINISQLESGLYFILFEDKGIVTSNKFIKN